LAINLLEWHRKLAKIWKQQEDETIAKLCRQFYEKALDLKQAFEKFDTDKSGSISYTEFVALLREMKMKLSNVQKYEFMRSIDADKNGMIDYKVRFPSTADPWYCSLTNMRIVLCRNSLIGSKSFLIGLAYKTLSPNPRKSSLWKPWKIWPIRYSKTRVLKES